MATKKNHNSASIYSGKKILLVTLACAISCLCHSQIKLTTKYNIRYYRMWGADSFGRDQHGKITPSLELEHKFSRVASIGLGATYGNKLLQFSIRDGISFYSLTSPNYTVVYPTPVFTFRFVSFEFCQSFYIKKYIKLKFGPYLSFNGSRNLSHEAAVGNYLKPYSMDALFKKREFGGLVNLGIEIPFHKNWSLYLNAEMAKSFNDLRKDKWKNVEKNYFNPYENTTVTKEIKSSKVINTYNAVGWGLVYNLPEKSKHPTAQKTLPE